MQPTSKSATVPLRRTRERMWSNGYSPISLLSAIYLESYLASVEVATNSCLGSTREYLCEGKDPTAVGTVYSSDLLVQEYSCHSGEHARGCCPMNIPPYHHFPVYSENRIWPQWRWLQTPSWA